MSYQYLSDKPVDIAIRAEHGNFYASKDDLIVEGQSIFIMVNGNKVKITAEEIYEI